ncbi:MAG: glycosyltransferase family 4 protein, partial [Actinomycetota bacterium]
QGTVAPICFSVRSARRIGSALRRFGPDVVHAHEPLSPSAGMLATIRSAAPVVGTFHAFTERSALLTTAAPVLRPVWRRLAIRIAVSEAAAAFVGHRFSGPVRIVPNGCDVDRFGAAQPAPGLPEGRRLLWVGRLDPQKGFGVALAAVERLMATHADVMLVVVGDGRDRTVLDRMRREVRSRVRLVGSVPYDELPRYHAACELFIAPSLGQESFGMVLVEAMAAGLPVVATDIPGYREVVQNKTDGLLVPPNDPDALAAAVGRILTDPALAGRLSEAVRARAERYRWRTVVDEIEGIYAEALASAGRPTRR